MSVAGRGSGDAGLSLVEVMVAMGIFVIGSLSLLSVLTSGMNGTFDNRARVTAANLAAADIDEARSLNYYALGNSVQTKTVDGRKYRVTRVVDVTMASGASSCIGSGSNKQRYKRVSTSVDSVTTPGEQKAFRDRTRPVRADTLVKAPVFDPSNPLGAIAFVVVDREGRPISGVPVATSTTTLTSDARGCAFFDGLAPGSQVVTVTRPGSVKIDGSSTLSKSVGVTAGQITSDVLRIDVAATITVRTNVYDQNGTVSGFAMPTGLSVRLAAPDRATATRFESTPKPVVWGADLTWTAYPSPGGYDAYLGPCTTVAHTDSEPGTTPPRIDLTMTPVTIQITGGSSDISRGQNKAISAQLLPLGGCEEPVTWSTRTDPTCKVNSNGTDGCWLKLALRRGTWRLTLEGGYSVDVTAQPRVALSTSISVSGSG